MIHWHPFSIWSASAERSYRILKFLEILILANKINKSLVLIYEWFRRYSTLIQLYLSKFRTVWAVKYCLWYPEGSDTSSKSSVHTIRYFIWLLLLQIAIYMPVPASYHIFSLLVLFTTYLKLSLVIWLGAYKFDSHSLIYHSLPRYLTDRPSGVI